MTLPSEELNAIYRTREYLRGILTMTLTEMRKKPRSIREGAYRCLRHYPYQCTVDKLWEDRIKQTEPWTITAGDEIITKEIG